MSGRDAAGAPGRFEGRVAIVTGGSKGIGRAIALRLASEGARVGITWFRDRDAAAGTVEEIDALSRGCAVRAMLKQPDAPARVVEQVRSELGEPDLLVSNAASGALAPLREITDAQWQWAMETNATALLRLAVAAPKLASIVALSSFGAARVLVKYGAIGVSKAALESLVRYLAVELAPDCHVNAISATVLDTESLRAFPRHEEALAMTLNATPAQRLATPEDIAALAAFLLSPEAAMITGQTVQLDGGFSLLGHTGLRVDEW